MSLLIEDYSYPLPGHRIAQHPVYPRDSSKLLFWNAGEVSHHHFYDIDALLPSGSSLVVNNTRVIHARVLLQKSTGALIELFLLEPLLPSKEVTQAMETRKEAVWGCMVGNLKRWKAGAVLSKPFDYNGGQFLLQAELITAGARPEVRLRWDADIPFSTLVGIIGEVPLPPYMNRRAETSDDVDYQTVYSSEDGAVAAPTAGLHFTEELLARLKEKGHKILESTLHIGAGTFKPVEHKNVLDHPMHGEQVVLRKSFLEHLLRTDEKIIAVGTTSLRILESIFWLGYKLKSGQSASSPISKLLPYEADLPMDRKEAIELVLGYMEKNGLSQWNFETQLMIMPGYSLRMAAGLITNFHQPKSTLLLLIASIVGDNWKDVYSEALNKNYRFLSFGDSSLLLP